MNWSQAKTWLILLFAGVNIFLLCNIISIDMEASTVPAKTLEQTAAILANNGITIDIKHVPAHIDSLDAIEVTNNIVQPQSIAELLLGSDYQTTNDSVYRKDTKRLNFLGDVIKYTDEKPSGQIYNLTADNAAEHAKQILSGLGFATSNAVVSSVEKTDEIYTIRMYQSVSGYPLFDSTFVIRLSADGIAYFEGSWFSVVSEASIFSNADKVKPATNALLEFVSDPVRISRGSSEITEIRLGFTTGEKNSYHKNVTALPTWRITAAGGDMYFYDAK